MLDKTGGEVHRDLLLRWDRILDELAGFEEKRPGNSVTALEELIGTQMAQVGLDNCFDVARPFPQGGSTGDFFRDKELQLRDRLYQRCYQVVGERAARMAADVGAGHVIHTMVGEHEAMLSMLDELEALGLAEVEHNARNNRMRAI